MIQITCEICKDLIPLVQDGVASGTAPPQWSRHIQSCPQCRVMWEGQIPRPADSSRILEKVRHRARVFMGMVLMFGVFFGLSLTASSRAVSEQSDHACDRRHRLLPVSLEVPVSYPVPSLCRASGHKRDRSVPRCGASGPGLPPAVVCAVRGLAAIGTVIAGLLLIVFQKED